MIFSPQKVVLALKTALKYHKLIKFKNIFIYSCRAENSLQNKILIYLKITIFDPKISKKLMGFMFYWVEKVHVSPLTVVRGYLGEKFQFKVL